MSTDTWCVLDLVFANLAQVALVIVLLAT